MNPWAHVLYYGGHDGNKSVWTDTIQNNVHVCAARVEVTSAALPVLQSVTRERQNGKASNSHQSGLHGRKQFYSCVDAVMYAQHASSETCQGTGGFTQVTP